MQPSSHRRFAPLVASAITMVALGCALMFATTASAQPEPATETYSFTETEPETYRFRLSKRDKEALRSYRSAGKLRRRAERARQLMQRDDERVARIQELLSEAQGNEALLREALEQRLVSRYKSNGVDDLAFLFDSGSVADVVTRNEVLTDAARSDRALAARHRITIQRLEDLQMALQELRDRRGEQAALLDERADELEGRLGEARLVHVDRKSQLDGDKATDGTWLVMAGETPSGMFVPMFPRGTLPYDGGIRTPAREATQQQIFAVLTDPRIQIYAGGRQDIAERRIDGRVLDAMRALTQRFGSIHVTSLVRGHGIYTTSGNISAHAYGCAVDIGSVGGIRIEAATQGAGSITEQAVLMLAGLPGDLAPHQVISLHAYGGSTIGMADHHDHIHLGYSC